MIKIGITGGIGSGKTTLCRMFEELGAPVFYSDIVAKELMGSDEGLKEAIIGSFGEECYVDSQLNRQHLARLVFDNPTNLATLNSIVHPRVKQAFVAWCGEHSAPYVILESAILFEAKFEGCVDRVLCVLSPVPMRIERVISRDNLSEADVEKRIANQMSDEQIYALSDHCVVNLEIEDLEDAAKTFDKKFRYAAANS